MAEDRGRAGEQDGQTGATSALLIHDSTVSKRQHAARSHPKRIPPSTSDGSSSAARRMFLTQEQNVLLLVPQQFPFPSLLQVASRVQKYFIKLTKAGIPVPGRTPNLCMYNKKVCAVVLKKKKISVTLFLFYFFIYVFIPPL